MIKIRSLNLEFFTSATQLASLISSAHTNSHYFRQRNSHRFSGQGMAHQHSTIGPAQSRCDDVLPHMFGNYISDIEDNEQELNWCCEYWWPELIARSKMAVPYPHPTSIYTLLWTNRIPVADILARSQPLPLIEFPPDCGRDNY
jgi:hypothetical protein